MIDPAAEKVLELWNKLKPGDRQVVMRLLRSMTTKLATNRHLGFVDSAPLGWPLPEVEHCPGAIAYANKTLDEAQERMRRWAQQERLKRHPGVLGFDGGVE